MRRGRKAQELGPGDNAWSDDERDPDRDGLSNIVEDHFMTQSTWNGNLAKCGGTIGPWESRDGKYYGSFSQRPFAEPTMMDADLDGDGLLDAEDDQDNDDVPNYSELDLRCGEDPATVDDDNDSSTPNVPNPDYQPNVHPYNPCAPYGGDRWLPVTGFPLGRTCPFNKPLDG